MSAGGEALALMRQNQARRGGHVLDVHLRGGDVARNSDSAKVPTRNRNSELHVTSHQTVRVFEESVGNAGYLREETP